MTNANYWETIYLYIWRSVVVACKRVPEPPSLTPPSAPSPPSAGGFSGHLGPVPQLRKSPLLLLHFTYLPGALGAQCM